MPKDKKPGRGIVPTGHPSATPSAQTPNGPSRVVVTQQQVKSHSGPIPSADELHAYESVIPGLPRTIVEWADIQIKHRQELERIATQAEIDHLRASDGDSRLGLWLGFVVAMSLIVVSGILAWQEKTWAAVGLSGGTLVGLVSVFVYGSQKKKRSNGNGQPLPDQQED